MIHALVFLFRTRFHGIRRFFGILLRLFRNNQASLCQAILSKVTKRHIDSRIALRNTNILERCIRERIEMSGHVFALRIHEHLEILRPSDIGTAPFFGHREFHRKVVLHHEPAQSGVRPNRTRNCTASHACFVIEHALSKRMVQADKFNIVVRHGNIAIEGHRHACATAHATITIGAFATFTAQIRLAVHTATASTERSHSQIRHARHRACFHLRPHRDEEAPRHSALFDIEPTVHQRIKHEILEFRFRIEFSNFVRDFLCLFRVARVEFQQAVTAVFNILAHLLAVFFDLRDDVFHKVFKACSRRCQSFNQRFRVLKEQFATAHERGAKRIQTFVVPAEHDFLTRTLHVRHVDNDILVLTNAVQAANTLFDKCCIEREVEQDQVMRELEVTAFGTNFRGNEQVGAIGLTEVCSRLVARHDAHVFVEHHKRTSTQKFNEQSFKRLHHLDGFANQQNLFVLVFLEESLEPFKAFIHMPSIREPRAEEAVLLNVRRCFEVAVSSHFYHFAISRIWFQRNLIEHSFRESAHALTRIAEHHRTRTHTIDNAAHPFARRHRL